MAWSDPVIDPDFARRTRMFYDHVVAIDTDLGVLAFTAERVGALTGLTLRRLQYWDERDFIRPSLTARQGRGRKRLYNFQDVVALKVAADLRREGVSLQEIRKVADHLRSLDYTKPLAEITFIAHGGHLYFKESDTWRKGVQPAQVLAQYVVPIQQIASDLRTRIVEMRQRMPGQIERRRGTLGSKPVFGGTRIPVAAVKRLLSDGAESAEILELYPDLTEEDIRAAAAEELPSRRHAG